MTQHTGLFSLCLWTQQGQGWWLLLIWESGENLGFRYSPFTPVSRKSGDKTSLSSYIAGHQCQMFTEPHWALVVLILRGFMNWFEGGWSFWKQLVTFWNKRKQRLRIKIYHVHVPTPHDACNCYILQTYTNKNFKRKCRFLMKPWHFILHWTKEGSEKGAAVMFCGRFRQMLFTHMGKLTSGVL